MGETDDPGRDSATPTRRQRAPTITIDTSAVSPSIAPPSSRSSSESLPDDPQRPSVGRKLSNGDVQGGGTSPVGHSPADIRPKDRLSFELKDSRPTSPHNVSSPVQKWDKTPQNFLAVPVTRSRGNSVDSEELATSPTSYGGETYLPSASESSQIGDGKSRLDTGNSTDPLLTNSEDALKPVPGSEQDFQVDNNKFAFSPGQLGKMFPKSLAAFHALGGLRGLELGLRSDRHAGLSMDEQELDGRVSFDEAVSGNKAHDDDYDQTHRDHLQGTSRSDANEGEEDDKAFSDRRRIFGDNRLPEKRAKSIWELMWLAYNDKVLILLTAAAIISLALGIYQSVTADDNSDKLDWIEGVAIVVAIVIVVLVGAANDWQKERQFVKLNKRKEERNVKVIRSGKSQEVSVFDIYTGDIIHIEPGDMIPVDGILVSGHGVKCDESSETGESDLAKKMPGDDAYDEIDRQGVELRKVDPFMISGSKVQEGVGTLLATGTGSHSSHGKIMMSLHEESQTTPLQSKLNILAEWIAKLGLAAGLLLFIVTFIQFCARLGSITGGGEAKGQAFLQVFIVAVTVIVVAVPEGLPLAVTLALAFATTRMMKDNNLVRLLKACETMGNATTICSDKTGTLTQNKMTVVAATIGTDLDVAPKTNKSVDSTTVDDAEDEDPKSQIAGRSRSTSTVQQVSLQESLGKVGTALNEMLKESILVNTTAFEGEVDGRQDFVGSKTEAALLTLARDQLAMGPLDEERANCNIVQVEPFDSKRKCMATVVRVNPGQYRLYVKGASELMLRKCTRVAQNQKNEVDDAPLTEELENAYSETIDQYANRSLRTIGFVYRDFTSENWPPSGQPTKEDDAGQIDFDKAFKDMTLLGVVGIQDPLRDGVPESVAICQKAGVVVRMVTGDNVMTAKAIATDAGIFTKGGLVLEGPKFRQMSKAEQREAIPKLQVLARSSPDDKKILVKRLIEMGETVAVTGDGTNDVPALKTADVGFAMGISGTEVAKEASDIILLDDNFNSIVRAMMWGRAVNDAVKKFLQFQITVNITAVLLTFISAVGDPHQQSVLNAVQLLWVNLIMDTFAALALATDPPSHTVLDRKPERKNASLISYTMWKMIIGQTIYQLTVTLVLNYGGRQLNLIGSDEPLQARSLHARDETSAMPRQLQTLVFNSFVWMQIFNQYNSRRLDNKFNILEGILRNLWFIGIQFIICGGQVLIIFVGGDAFKVEPLVWQNWVISLVLGAVSLPVGAILRCIPDDWLRKVTDPIGRTMPGWITRRINKAAHQPELTVEDEESGPQGHPEHFEWNPALESIRDELVFIKRIRGGRLRRIKYDITHPRQMLARSRDHSRSLSRANSNFSSTVTHTPSNEPHDGVDSKALSPSASPVRSRLGSRRSRSNSAFGPAAAMAGVIAGSIGGWSPVELQPGERSRRPSVTGSSNNENDTSNVGATVPTPPAAATLRQHKSSVSSTLAPPPTGSVSGRSSRSNSGNALAPPVFDHV